MKLRLPLWRRSNAERGLMFRQPGRVVLSESRRALWHKAARRGGHGRRKSAVSADVLGREDGERRTTEDAGGTPALRMAAAEDGG